MKFVESLNPTLRRISITFIHNLMRANGICLFLDDDETEFMFDLLAEEDGSDPQDRKDHMKLLDSYQEGKSTGC